MHKRMTITLDEAVYEGLYRTVGKRRMSQFIEDLLRPHVLDTSLDDGYRAMAADKAAANLSGKGEDMEGQVMATVILEPAQALALAQFVKRVGWQEVRQNAVDDDEAYAMRDALGELAKALREAGYAPR